MTSEKTGHADSPRQDSQRPSHRDRGDAGGQESRNEKDAESHAEVEPGAVRGGRATGGHGGSAADEQPVEGRTPQRPGQDARSQPSPGVRDPSTLDPRTSEGLASPPPKNAPEGGVGSDEPEGSGR